MFAARSVAVPTAAAKGFKNLRARRTTTNGRCSISSLTEILAKASSRSALTYQCNLNSSVETFVDRKTKIVATLGPSSSSPEVLKQLLASGLDVGRINCAHGDKESYSKLVDALRKASDEVRREGIRSVDGISRPDVGIAAIAMDIKGPEIRIGRFGSDVPMNNSGSRLINVKRGDRLLLTCDPRMAVNADGSPCSSKERGIFVTYPKLALHTSRGDLIFVDDGNVELKVLEVDQSNSRVLVECLNDNPILERKGVNLPGLAFVDLPSVTKKDLVDMETARELGVDYIFASFVQSADMVREIRRALNGPHGTGSKIRIISKIESQSGLDNYDEILEESDGIMVARGDLGVQIPPERVFLAQKRL
jgi:pyruvate kinase